MGSRARRNKHPPGVAERHTSCKNAPAESSLEVLRHPSRDEEVHGHEGTPLDPGLDIVIDTPFLMNGCDDRAASGLVQNGCRLDSQVRLYVLFEVEGELGVCEEVRVPVAASWGSPRDVSRWTELILHSVDFSLIFSGL